MDTKQIDYVLELARTKNFNRAAENLFISQSALTYHIKTIESEIGFALFERSPRGTVLTPAGEQFCAALRNIKNSFRLAVEQGQNFSSRYTAGITIALPVRSALYFLPEAIDIFERDNPEIYITPHFHSPYDISSFMKHEEDIIFARQSMVQDIHGIKSFPLFKSKIYLVTEKSDPLAQNTIIRPEDLTGRVLMIGGSSPPELKTVQQRVIDTVNISYFNSNDRDTTLTNIAAHKGVCLAPGFMNDHSGEFSWIPFDCPEDIPCVLCIHSEDRREVVWDFVKLLQKIYKDNPDFMA